MVYDLAVTLGPLITNPEIDVDGLRLLAAGLAALAEAADQHADQLAP